LEWICKEDRRDIFGSSVLVFIVPRIGVGEMGRDLSVLGANMGELKLRFLSWPGGLGMGWHGEGTV
jgi:hypothetical protein